MGAGQVQCWGFRNGALHCMSSSNTRPCRNSSVYKEKYQVSDEISKQMHHDFQFFNEINADSSFSNVDTTSSLTCITYYKCKMQAVQKGNIGITLVSNWFVPFSRSKSNNDAARRAIDFMLGW